MKNRYHLIALALLAAFAFQVIGSMRLKSPSSDEYLYIGAGYSYYKTGEIQISFEHPPLMKYIAAFPLLFMDDVQMNFDDVFWTQEPKNQFGFSYRFLWSHDVDRIMFAARLPFAMLAIGLGWLLFKWGRDLWGDKGGLMALGLYAFSPNLITHARFTTMDLGLTAFFLGCLYAYWKYVQSPSKGRLLMTGLLLGLALGAKFSAIILLPVLGVLLFLRWQQVGEARLSDFMRRVIYPYAVMLGVAYLFLYCLYLFPSNPLFYWDGMMEVNENHNPNVPSYLNGEFYLGKAPLYFLYCFLYKTPDILLLLLPIAVYAFIRKTRTSDVHMEWILVLPPLFLFVFTQVLANDLGLRYLLPIYPFLHLFVARIAVAVEGKRWAVIVLLAALGWYAMDTASIYPNYLSYFNRVSGGPANGHRLLADSNLNWGQDLKLLSMHLKKKQYGKVKLRYPWDGAPGYYGIDYELVPDVEWQQRPVPGVYVINILSLLEGQYVAEKFGLNTDWLDTYQPSERIGYSFYVYQFVDEPN